MNEFTELIISRRSVRKYRAEQVKEEQLQAIVKAGVYAPNGINAQRWHFTVIQNVDILKELNTLVRKAFVKNIDSDNKIIKMTANAARNENYSFYYGAPTVVLVSSDISNQNAIADSVCAVENILLAAHAEGLGGVYINQLTWFDNEPEIRALLTKIGVPANYHVCASAAIGYSAGTPGRAIRNEDVVNYIR